MSDDELEFSERGFAGYGEFKDKDGAKVRVVESSIAGEPCCRVFTTRREDDVYHKDHILASIAGVDVPHRELLDMWLDGSDPHLNIPQAKQLIGLLMKFIDHNEDPEHWKNDLEYMAEWRERELVERVRAVREEKENEPT